MSSIVAIALRPSSWAAVAALDADGRTVQPSTGVDPNCQLPEQVLRYLPSRQMARPIASGSRGAVVGTSLSGFTGGPGGVNKIRGRQEVRQMSERTPHLPVSAEPDGSQLGRHSKGIAPHMDSVEFGRPTGRLARAGSEVAV